MIIYRERLIPQWWVYLLAAALVGMLSVAYGAAFSALVGWIMFLVIFGLLALAMTLASPIIEVSDVLQVDVARLPLSSIANTSVLDADGTRLARRSREHATDFTLLKLWSSSTALSITLDDHNDPHPGWLISTRNPMGLQKAIDVAVTKSGNTSTTSDTV
jgi:hypothetical protein